MRVTPPKSLKLSQAALLEDLRERLGDRDPELAAKLTRGHPAWLLLQEAAWLVETLSERLDEYPWAVVQQLASLLGAELGPAQPALGVVVAQANEAGRLTLGDSPAKWRFLSPQSEERGLVEYALVEDDVPVVPVTRIGAARLQAAELAVVELDADGRHGWFGAERPSRAFARETLTWELVAADPDALLGHARDAIASLAKERAIGWLVASAERVDDRVLVTMTLDVAAALGPVGAVAEGESLDVAWAAPDESTWTPPVRIAADPRLPPSLRGARPMPGDAPDRLSVDGVPAGFPLAELLWREARPVPRDVVGALWRTLSHLNTRLAPLRPAVRRSLNVGPDEPAWVTGALSQDAWFTLADQADQRLFEVVLGAGCGGQALRLAWVTRRTASRIRVFAVLEDGGMLEQPLPLTECWSIELPAHEGSGTVFVTAVEVTLPRSVRAVVSSHDGPALGAMVNPLLVVNAPAVRDGRTLTVARAVPEAASLLYRDVVSEDVVDRLTRQGLPDRVTQLLRAMPLSRITIDGQPGVDDFRGVQVDAPEGQILFNAPDTRGRTHRIRRGSSLELQWYRRTDGVIGNNPAGAVALAEQAPSTRPRLSAPTNPLPFAFGADRESEESAVSRMFGPPQGVPVIPADWEREILRALGTPANGWIVRCWGYAERTTVHGAMWPRGDAAAQLVRDDLEREVAHAGPDTLLVVLGPPDRLLSEEDLAWARNAVDRLVADAARRVPTVRRAVVLRLWPLTLRGSGNQLVFPSFGLAGLSGELVDTTGRAAPVPTATLLLNACVVARESA